MGLHPLAMIIPIAVITLRHLVKQKVVGIPFKEHGGAIEEWGEEAWCELREVCQNFEDWL